MSITEADVNRALTILKAAGGLVAGDMLGDDVIEVLEGRELARLGHGRYDAGANCLTGTLSDGVVAFVGITDKGQRYVS